MVRQSQHRQQPAREQGSARRVCSAQSKEHPSPAATLGLDSVIHERVRLAIVGALAVNDALSFNDLKKLLEITDGNLSVHARKLEDAGYVKCSKSFVGRQPRTEYALSAAGRRAFESYLRQMESVIKSARKS